MLPPAGFVGAGLLAGGVPGIVLGFTGVLLALERLLFRFIGPAGDPVALGEREFARLVRARRLDERRHRATPLRHLPDDTGWAAVAARRRLGRQAIPVRSVVATVERDKADAFDAAFRPPPWSRHRWVQIYAATQHGTTVPPIAVYRVGEEHVLRDGHHRVSVLRALGADDVDADVVELQAPAVRDARHR